MFFKLIKTKIIIIILNISMNYTIVVILIHLAWLSKKKFRFRKKKLCLCCRYFSQKWDEPIPYSWIKSKNFIENIITCFRIYSVYVLIIAVKIEIALRNVWNYVVLNIWKYGYYCIWSDKFILIEFIHHTVNLWT